MTCQELADHLADYVSGELTVDVRELFRLHLNGCRPCVVVVELYELTIRITKALPKADPLPPALEARLRAAISDGHGRL